MHMEMAAGIAVSAIINLVRLEYLVYRPGNLCNICKKCAALVIADIDHLTDMVFVRENDSAAFALFLK